MSQHLLLLQASAQPEARSLTRRLGETFLEVWRECCPGAPTRIRDLAAQPVPQITADWIAAAFTAPDQRTDPMTRELTLSDALIDEVARADVIVIATPMYNYGMPAALKAWFDQIARLGRTFSFDLSRGDWPIEPLLSGKALAVLSARGEFGFAPGGPRAHLNALDPGIAACAHYLGVRAGDIHRVAVEYQEFKDDRHARSWSAAQEEVRRLAAALASGPGNTHSLAARPPARQKHGRAPAG